jgi:enoyl-CoA hydratase/carnithine racemase
MLTTDEPLLHRARDAHGVVTLTLNRPQALNALSEAMLQALQSELDALAGDEGVRVLVLAAAGKAFCAGHDLKEMRAAPSLDYYRELFERCSRMMLAIQRLPVPVIARVQGVATAAGCQLVAMCDLAVASRDARFAVSGVNFGLFCSTPVIAFAAVVTLPTEACAKLSDASWSRRNEASNEAPLWPLSVETTAKPREIAGTSPVAWGPSGGRIDPLRPPPP